MFGVLGWFWLFIIISVFAGGLVIVIIYLVLRARLEKPATGYEGMVGEIGRADTDITQNGGKVFVRGELWNAWSHRKIKKNTRVKIVGIEGMVLKVEPYYED
ncbi:MAG TPA: hypothetical protein ENI43_05345 [Firmicutes bacterium]|nr:hypothetical protein [Bacillota bacterium]